MADPIDYLEGALRLIALDVIEAETGTDDEETRNNLLNSAADEDGGLGLLLATLQIAAGLVRSLAKHEGTATEGILDGLAREIRFAQAELDGEWEACRGPDHHERPL